MPTMNCPELIEKDAYPVAEHDAKPVVAVETDATE
jgi:hypothetical protein